MHVCACTLVPLRVCVCVYKVWALSPPASAHQDLHTLRFLWCWWDLVRPPADCLHLQWTSRHSASTSHSHWDAGSVFSLVGNWFLPSSTGQEVTSFFKSSDDCDGLEALNWLRHDPGFLLPYSSSSLSFLRHRLLSKHQSSVIRPLGWSHRWTGPAQHKPTWFTC